MAKLDLSAIAEVSTTGYPAPFDQDVLNKRYFRRLAPVAGLLQLGASLVRLVPGGWSSQRHWHEGEDEILVMLEGEAVLVEDSGETLLRAGDVAAFPAGVRDGHHLVNRSGADCRFFVVSAGPQKGGEYSDIDMRFTAEGGYERKDGTPYPARRLP